MSNILSIEAPCKINLHLKVKNRRSDGFHDLESIFLAVDLRDTLHFELGTPGMADEFLVEDKRLRSTGPCEELPLEDNIVLKAVKLFRAKTGFNQPLRIRLEKRIPLGAGLGGGSSDGASTLMALNELAGGVDHSTSLSEAELRQMAAELGSDVPFFLSAFPPREDQTRSSQDGAAFVSGRGEHIRPIEGPSEFAVVLVNPGFPSNTAEAFRLLDAHREEFPAEGSPAEKPGQSEQDLIDALKGPPSQWPYGNDFLEPFLVKGSPPVRDAYKAILGDLEAQGADFCGLTGSGSTCFGIFTRGGAAKKAVQSLSKPGIFTHLTFPLARLANAVLK